MNHRVPDKRLLTQNYTKTAAEIESEEIKFEDHESQSGSQFDSSSNFDNRILNPLREKRGESQVVFQQSSGKAVKNNGKNGRTDSGYLLTDSHKQNDGVSDLDDSFRPKRALPSDNDSAIGGESQYGQNQLYKQKKRGGAPSGESSHGNQNNLIDSHSNAGSSYYVAGDGKKVMNRNVTKRELDPFDDDVGSFYDGANNRDQIEGDNSMYHANR